MDIRDGDFVPTDTTYGSGPPRNRKDAGGTGSKNSSSVRSKKPEPEKNVVVVKAKGPAHIVVETPKVDFSESAVRSAVRKTTIQHPLTLYPIAVGALGAVALGLSLLDPTLITFSLVSGFFGIGIGSWVVNYGIRKDAFAGDYLKSMREKLDRYRESTLANLQAELEECRSVQGGDGYAGQAVEQFRELKEKFDALCDVLGKRFNETELTYGRYRGTAEQLCLASIDNLRDVATLLESAKAIDNDDYIARRLAELSKLKILGGADIEEKNTLEERARLRVATLEKVNSLLTLNEEAMTTMDKTTTALADVKTKQGDAVVNMETSLKELEELANRTGKYARE